MELVEAVVKNTNTSDKFVIVNKSSAATDVKAEVTVVNPEGLEFLAAAPTATNLGANVFMQIENGKGTKGSITPGTPEVVSKKTDGSVTGTVTVSLAGADNINDYLSYQGAPVAELGGGHEILRYNKPTMNYQIAELNLKVVTNDVAGISSADDKKTAEAAWGAYVKGLKDGTYTKPDVDVVYTLSNAVNAPTYTAITGSYGTDGSIWFERSAGQGGFTDHSKLTAASVKQTDGSYRDVSTADLAKIEFPSSAAGWANVTWDNLKAIGQPPLESTVVLRLTYDGGHYEVTVTP